MKDKGLTPIVASLLIFLILFSSGLVLYKFALDSLASPDYSAFSEGLAITNVVYDDNNFYLYVTNRGGKESRLDAAYVCTPSNEVLIFRRMNYTLSAGSSDIAVVPRRGVSAEGRLIFKVVSQSGSMAVHSPLFMAYYKPELKKALPSVVTSKAQGFASPNFKAIAATDDKSVHVVFANGNRLGYSISVDGGYSFADQWLVSGDWTISNPNLASDVDNNLHLVYGESKGADTRVSYVMLSFNSSYGGNPRTSSSYVVVNSTHSWLCHFVAMDSKLNRIELYMRNASSGPSRLYFEIRRALEDGRPDMSPFSFVADGVISSVPNAFQWVSVDVGASLEKGSRYALILRAEGTFHWAYDGRAYAGSLGGWSHSGDYKVNEGVHLCFRIPGWFGWVSSSSVALEHWWYDYIKVEKPVVALYRYLKSPDQQQNSYGTLSGSIYGNNLWAQSFRPSSNKLSGLMLFLFRSGNPGDHLYVEVRRDNGSRPDMSQGGLLAYGKIYNTRVNEVGGYRWFDCVFAEPVELNSSSTYWIVLRSPGSNASNYWIVGGTNYNSYGGGLAAWSSDGGATWTSTNQDLAFRTYSRIGESPAVAWIYRNTIHEHPKEVHFLRCRPDADPLNRSNWVNRTGGTDIERIQVTTHWRLTELYASISYQTGTGNIYVFYTCNYDFYGRPLLSYWAFYRWNAGTGNWDTSTTGTIAGDNVSITEFSSAADPLNDRVLLVFVNSTGHAHVKRFEHDRSIHDLGQPIASARKPSIASALGRAYVFYEAPSGIAYRYYDGAWSDERLCYGGSYSLPNAIYNRYANSIALAWLSGPSTILYGVASP